MNELPLEELRIGDEIVGPFGRYHLVIRNLTDQHIEGVYTKVPKHGYPLGSLARYPKRDWERDRKGMVTCVRRAN